MATPVQLDFSKAVPINNSAQSQPAQSDAPVTLDFSKAQPVSPTATPTPQPSDNEGLLTKAADAVGNTIEGVGKGALQTLSGTDEFARQHLPAFLTNSDLGFGKPADLAHVREMASPTGTAQKVGAGIEDLTEFLLGDEALKGASLSERLLNAGKTAKVIENSPRLTAVVKAGIQALRGATIGGTQAGLKSGGDVGSTATGAVAGGVGNVVIPGAINAAKELPELVNTLKNVIRPGIIQDAFQGDIRRIINEAATEHGVAPSNAASIRDVANEVSNSLQSRAKSAYQALDNATGGRVQRFSDAIKAVQKKLSNLNGIATPDDEGAWIEKLNDLQDAHEQAMSEAEQQGVPRTLLDQANADFRKSKAMADLNRAVRASSEGLRPELASGANKPLPEKVNTGKLFSRVNKLYDSGRLQDAIGTGRSSDLLRATNDAHAASQTAQNLRQLAGSTAKHTLYYGATWELLKHLLGE